MSLAILPGEWPKEPGYPGGPMPGRRGRVLVVLELGGVPWILRGGPVGVAPSVALEQISAAGLSAAADSRPWWAQITDWFARDGAQVASAEQGSQGKTGAIQKAIDWLSRQARKVCVRDCGRLFAIEGWDSSRNAIAMRETTAADCASRLTVPAAYVPGWISPCPPTAPQQPFPTPQPQAPGAAPFDLARFAPWIAIAAVFLLLRSGDSR